MVSLYNKVECVYIEKGVLTVKVTIENINKENLSVYVVCVVYGVATAGNS